MTQEEDFKGQVAWCRKDWRERLGIPIPKTLEDWTNMLDAFANQDPDGNLIKDTYGISYIEQAVPNFMILAHGAFVEDWVNQNGRWIHGACSDQALNAIKYCRDLYQREIIDPAYITQKELKQLLDEFAQGKIGVMTYGSMPDETEEVYVYFEKANPDKDPFKCIEILPFPEGPDGKIRNRPAYNYSGAISFSSDVNDEKLNKILDIFEWTLSEEGEMMMLYGFEEEDYTLENGNPINLLGKNQDGTTRTAVDKYPTAALGYYFNQKSTQRMAGTLSDSKYIEISTNIIEMYKGCGAEKEINMKAKGWYSPEKAKINFTKAFYTIANDCILSPEGTDITVKWQKYWQSFNETYHYEQLFDDLTKYMES